MGKGILVLLNVLFVLSSASAFAFDLNGSDLARLNGYVAWCQQSYRFDSYGRGIEAGFRGQSLRPALIDEECYRLGVKKGEEVAATKDAFGTCERAFAEGYAQGLVFSPYGAGVECYVAGYTAGAAALDVGAREKNRAAVGNDCVDEYERGGSEAKAMLVKTPKMDARLQACYLTGYFDGQMF